VVHEFLYITSNGMNIQTLLKNFITFLDGTILPFLLAIAGLVFFWNAFRYFILGGSNPDDQEKAKSLALWGVLGFVVIVSLWGIVNLITKDLTSRNQVITPDYMESKGTNVSPSYPMPPAPPVTPSKPAPEYNDWGDPNPSVPFPVTS